MPARDSNKWSGTTLVDAVGRMIEDSGKPVKAIAADIGKPYSTLCRELDPEDEGAKLGAEVLYPITLSVCGPRPGVAPPPLEWFAHRLHFTVHPFGCEEPDAPTFHEEAMQDGQAKSKAEMLMLSAAHPNLVDQAYAETWTEMRQTAARYRRQWEEGVLP